MDHNGVFKQANDALVADKYDEAIELYTQLQAAGNHAAVNHNKGLAYALNDQPDEAMQELNNNMKAYEKYARSWVLAAEIHRRAARGSAADSAVSSMMLVDASKLIRPALEIDRFDPQACIVASDIMTACLDSHTEAITWHINALAAIAGRKSKRSASFTTVFMDNCADEALHYFDMPPEEAVTTGGLPADARSAGKCLAIIADEIPPLQEPWASWPKLLVTYDVAPRRTSPGHIHVRTEHRWAARFQAARHILDVDIPTAIVWDSQSCAPPNTPEFLDSEALMTVTPHLLAFCMKPASTQELSILKQLFNPQNVPPSTCAEESEEMAERTFHFLADDCKLDIEEIDTAQP